MAPLPISFNNTPGSGLVAPLFSFEVNSGGQFSSTSRVLLLGHKTSAGAAPVNVPVIVGSQADADAAFGPGSMLREMVRILRQNAPAQEVWAIPVTDTGTAQTWTITVGAGAIGTAGVGRLRIQDEEMPISVSATDTTTTVAAAIAAAINAYFNPLTGAQLPVTATAAVAVATVTARHLGATMSDLEFFLPTAGGNLFTTTNVTIAAGTAATGNPTLTTALAALGDDQYDLVVSPFADATSIAAYTATFNDTFGRWSYLRQSYGHVITCSTGNLSAQTTLGLTLNDRHVTIVPRIGGSPQPAWLWAAGFAGRTCTWLFDYVTGNVSRNQTGLAVQGLTAPRDRSTWWAYSARNTLNTSGISTWTGSIDGTVAVDKLVTTQRTGAGGLADSTFRDLQAMLQLTHILRYIRFAVAQACTNKAIADVNPGGLGALITPKDIKAVLIGAYDQLAQWGLVENVAGFIAALNVQRNSGNPARVDVLLPLQRVKPLDILAANAVLYSGTIPN